MGIRDDLICGMRRKEVTLTILADFSKAFDMVCFKTVIRKMFQFGFSRCFLTWLSNYLSDRRRKFGIRRQSVASLMVGSIISSFDGSRHQATITDE
jgi:hypothetical protein